MCHERCFAGTGTDSASTLDSLADNDDTLPDEAPFH